MNDSVVDETTRTQVGRRRPARPLTGPTGHPDGRGRRGLLAAWLDERQARLRYVFTTPALAEVGLTGPPAYQALRRLRAAGRVSPIGTRSSLWAIVPPEHRQAGAPPLVWLLDDIMAALGLPYYIGLRSAAEWYGATHYAMQVTVVVVPTPRRPLVVGRERIRFVVNRRVEDVPVLAHPGGVAPIRVSTPEATAVDLVRYAPQSGGMTAVVTALAQMHRRCDRRVLRQVLDCYADVPTAQRLGYCLDRVSAPSLARSVADWLAERPTAQVTLEIAAPRGRGRKAQDGALDGALVAKGASQGASALVSADLDGATRAGGDGPSVVMPWNVRVTRAPEIDL